LTLTAVGEAALAALTVTTLLVTVPRESQVNRWAVVGV
jgi:hypothetical protein